MNDIPFPYYCITINKLQYCIVMCVCKFCWYRVPFAYIIIILIFLLIFQVDWLFNLFMIVFNCSCLYQSNHLFLLDMIFVKMMIDCLLCVWCFFFLFFFQSTIDVKIYFQPILLINLRKLSVTIKIGFNYKKKYPFSTSISVYLLNLMCNPFFSTQILIWKAVDLL